MKIAILTYGEYRTAEYAVSTWNVLQTNHDIDVYVHTQTESISKNGLEKKNITENDIKKLFPKSFIWLEKRDEFENDKLPRDIHMNFRSFRFLYDKLEKSGKFYDFIIVNRLDTTLLINDVDDFLDTFDKNAIYTLRGELNHSDTFLQDHFFMGSSDIMMYLLKNLPAPEKMIYSHQDFGKYILSLNFKNLQSKCLSLHVRENQIEFLKNINLKNFFKIEHQSILKEITKLETENNKVI